jgi:hypothetical protein
MTDREHEELAAVLHSVRGAVALSSYRCQLMDRLYGDWRRVDADTRRCNSSKGERTESVWLNYEPAAPPRPAVPGENGNLCRWRDRPRHRQAWKRLLEQL